MFDLLMRDKSGAGVPVPLPGRGLAFMGTDGAMRVKLETGLVVEPEAVKSPLMAAASSDRSVWTTAKRELIGFDTAGLFPSGGALSFLLLGSNNHLTTDANLTVSLRIGGNIVLTQVFALGTVAKSKRAWRVEGSILFDALGMLATMRAAVDGLALTVDVGTGAFVPLSPWTYVAVEASLSAAVAGANLSLLGGYALKEF